MEPQREAPCRGTLHTAFPGGFAQGRGCAVCRQSEVTAASYGDNWKCPPSSEGLGPTHHVAFLSGNRSGPLLGRAGLETGHKLPRGPCQLQGQGWGRGNNQRNEVTLSQPCRGGESRLQEQ